MEVEDVAGEVCPAQDSVMFAACGSPPETLQLAVNWSPAYRIGGKFWKEGRSGGSAM